MGTDNPVVMYWEHDALSNCERMVTDFGPDAARGAAPGVLYIAQRADGSREVVDASAMTDPAARNTRAGETKGGGD